MSLHRAHARRNVRLAQISALGLVALAGMLAAMPAPIVDSPAPPAPSAGAQGTNLKDAPAIDFTKAADVLNVLVAKSAPVATPTVPEGEATSENGVEGDEVIVATPEDGPPHFRYVGLASSPRRTYAFIADYPNTGDTQTVAQGEYIGEYMLLGISSEKLVIADCEDIDTRHEYVIENRPETAPPESTVSMSRPAAPAAPANAKDFNNPANPGRAGEMPVHMPANVNDPAMMKERAREWEEKRSQMNINNNAVNRNGVTPPTLPPTRAQPRPTSTPQNKNGANKEKEALK